MKTIHGFAWVALLVLVVLVGCRGQEPAKGPKEYPIKGKVVTVDLAKPAVKLDHEDIPGFMEAMVMSFPVANAKLLEGLKPGDQVHGRLNVDAEKFVITELAKR